MLLVEEKRCYEEIKDLVNPSRIDSEKYFFHVVHPHISVQPITVEDEYWQNATSVSEFIFGQLNFIPPVWIFIMLLGL